MQRGTSVCVRARGLEPPVLLGLYWRFCREWGPPFRNKGHVMEGVFSVYAGLYDDARDALARHGITMTYCSGMGPEASWEWVLERLHAGIPVTALLDSYHLPVYLTFYQKLHETHVYVVGGYDPANAVVYLVNPRQKVEVWPTPLNEFMTAWSREEYEWYDIQVPDRLPPYTTDDLRDDLWRSLRQMLPAHRGESWRAGVPAIRRFADDFATYPQRFEPEVLKGILEDGFHQLPSMREQRWLFSTRLRLIALQLGFDELHDVSLRVYEAGKRWSVARGWCVRAAEMENLDRGVGRLVQKLREAAAAEEESASALRSLLESPRWPRGIPIDLGLRPDPADVGAGLAETYLG